MGLIYHFSRTQNHLTMMEMKKENNKTGVKRKHQTKQNVNKERRGLKGGKVCDVSVDGEGWGLE